jgi:hypothetical protein
LPVPLPPDTRMLRRVAIASVTHDVITRSITHAPDHTVARPRRLHWLTSISPLPPDRELAESIDGDGERSCGQPFSHVIARVATSGDPRWNN